MPLLLTLVFFPTTQVLKEVIPALQRLRADRDTGPFVPAVKAFCDALMLLGVQALQQLC